MWATLWAPDGQPKWDPPKYDSGIQLGPIWAAHVLNGQPMCSPAESHLCYFGIYGWLHGMFSYISVKKFTGEEAINWPAPAERL